MALGTVMWQWVSLVIMMNRKSTLYRQSTGFLILFRTFSTFYALFRPAKALFDWKMAECQLMTLFGFSGWKKKAEATGEEVEMERRQREEKKLADVNKITREYNEKAAKAALEKKQSVSGDRSRRSAQRSSAPWRRRAVYC